MLTVFGLAAAFGLGLGFGAATGLGFGFGTGFGGRLRQSWRCLGGSWTGFRVLKPHEEILARSGRCLHAFVRDVIWKTRRKADYVLQGFLESTDISETYQCGNLEQSEA